MEEVFIVEVSSGEYEEFSTWIDRVFSTHDRAVARVNKLAGARDQKQVGWYDITPGRSGTLELADGTKYYIHPEQVDPEEEDHDA